MKLLVMTAGILLCAASAFAHDGWGSYGEGHGHGRHRGYEQRRHVYREYREECAYPEEVTYYRTEYRPVEPRVTVALPPLPPLPPLPRLPLPPFLRFH